MTYPTIRPALTLDFQKSRKLDPRITFSRSSSATYLDPATGLIKTAPDGVARFEKEGLLIEEARTNLAENSEDFSLWTAQNSTVLTAQGTAPDGTNTAFKIQENTSTISHSIKEPSNSTWSGAATLSCYVKPAGRNFAYMGFTGVSQTSVTFDLVNKVSSYQGTNVTSGSVEDAGNGWLRIVAVFPNSITSGSATVGPAESDSLAGLNYTGDGSSGILAWGAQLEQGNITTSYIPTTSSTVTRAADVASISNAEMLKVVNLGGNACLMTTHWSTSGANQERIWDDGAGMMRIGQWRSNQIRSFRDGGNFSISYTPIPGQENYNTVFESRDGNDIYIGNNAGAYGSNTSTQTLPATGNFLFGYQSNGQRKQTIARMLYYPQPLTQAELEATSEAMT